MRTFLCSTLLLLPILIFGWVLNFPPTFGWQMWAHSIDATPDGGVLVAAIEHEMYDTLVVFNLNSIGETEWRWNADYTLNDFYPTIASYPSGAMQLLYYSLSLPGLPLRLVKLSAPDSEIWENLYSEDDPRPVCMPFYMDVDNYGNCIITGVKVNLVDSLDVGRIWAARLDESGDYDMEVELFEAYNPDDTLLLGTAIATYDDNIFIEGVYIVGDIEHNNTILLHGALIDHSGEVLWTWTNSEWFNFSPGLPYFIAAYSADHFLLGLTYIGDTISTYLFCLDASGEPLWSMEFKSTDDNTFITSAAGVSDGFVLVGEQYFTDDSIYAWAGKVSFDGDFVWQQQYHFGAMLTDVVSFPDDGFAACGMHGTDLIVIRTDADGDTSFTSINSDKSVVPVRVKISASPNPFNSSVKITLSNSSVVAGDGNSDDGVTVAIYDLRGNVVAYPSPVQETATHRSSCQVRTYIWRPDNSITSGTYLVEVKVAGKQTIVKRIVYLK